MKTLKLRANTGETIHVHDMQSKHFLIMKYNYEDLTIKNTYATVNNFQVLMHRY